MKNRQVLEALRKHLGTKKIWQRDVDTWSTDKDSVLSKTAKKGYTVVELPELGVWVSYKPPTL